MKKEFMSMSLIASMICMPSTYAAEELSLDEETITSRSSSSTIGLSSKIIMVKKRRKWL